MTVGRRYLILLMAAPALLGGCGEQGNTFRLLVPAQYYDQAIAEELVEVFEHNSRHRIELVPLPDSYETPLDALEEGYADFALASNSQQYRKGITTVMPLYPTVLHILYRRDRPADSLEELFRGATVAAGPAGSASRRLMTEILGSFDLPEEAVTFADETDKLADVIVLYLPILPESMPPTPR